jgi:hypothetical protein
MRNNFGTLHHGESTPKGVLDLSALKPWITGEAKIDDRQKAKANDKPGVKTDDKPEASIHWVEFKTSKQLPKIPIDRVINISGFKDIGRNRYRGEHPYLGSKTGTNLGVDLGNDTFCNYHNGAKVGGDAWVWLAMECGVIDWMDSGKGALDTMEAMGRVKRHAVERGLCTAEELGLKPEAPMISEDQLDTIKPLENPRMDVRLADDHFISKYVGYGCSKCDAYREYHFAMALGMLSIATNRNAVIRLAQGNVYPNIWSFCLGPSTISRKSAAFDIGQDIITMVFPGMDLPQSYSPEALVEVLSEMPRSYLIKDEAAAMLQAMQKNYMLEMRDLYCILYDCKSYSRKLRSGQRKEKREFPVIDPFINIMCATTPEAFREYTSVLDVTSGWLLRFLYFYPTYEKDWMPFKPRCEVELREHGEIVKRLVCLKDMFYDRSEPLDVELDQNAWTYFQDWQKARELDLQKADTDRIKRALFGRLGPYALKLALLFTVGRADYEEGDKISLVEVVEACRLIDEYFLPTGVIVCEEVAMETSRNLQNKMIDLLRRNGGKMLKTNMLRSLHVKLKDVDEAEEALIASEELGVFGTKGKGKPQVWYIYKPKIILDRSEGEVKNRYTEEFPHNSSKNSKNTKSSNNPMNSSNGSGIHGTFATEATIATNATIVSNLPLERKGGDHPHDTTRQKDCGKCLQDPEDPLEECGTFPGGYQTTAAVELREEAKVFLQSYVHYLIQQYRHELSDEEIKSIVLGLSLPLAEGSEDEQFILENPETFITVIDQVNKVSVWPGKYGVPREHVEKVLHYLGFRPTEGIQDMWELPLPNGVLWDAADDLLAPDERVALEKAFLLLEKRGEEITGSTLTTEVQRLYREGVPIGIVEEWLELKGIKRQDGLFKWENLN